MSNDSSSPSSRLHLSPQSWIDYFPHYLSDEEANHLMHTLIETQEWEHRAISVFGKDVKQPRLMSWGGDLPYRYSGQTLPVHPIPDALITLWKAIELKYEHPFNHVVLNYYRDGKDHMGMHADDERELGRNPLIVALSLGASRPFDLEIKQRRRGKKRRKKQMRAQEQGQAHQDGQSQKERIDERTLYPLGKRYRLTLEHGSLMAMGGDLQHTWRHGVPKIKGQGECGPRLNITFRYLLGEPGEVPFGSSVSQLLSSPTPS